MDSHGDPVRQESSHFIFEETEFWGDQVTCPKPHMQNYTFPCSACLRSLRSPSCSVLLSPPTSSQRRFSSVCDREAPAGHPRTAGLFGLCDTGGKGSHSGCVQRTRSAGRWRCHGEGVSRGPLVGGRHMCRETSAGRAEPGGEMGLCCISAGSEIHPLASYP